MQPPANYAIMQSKVSEKNQIIFSGSKCLQKSFHISAGSPHLKFVQYKAKQPARGSQLMFCPNARRSCLKLGPASASLAQLVTHGL